MDFILSLELPQFFDLLVKAYEAREKDQAFQMWLVRYRHMTKENFISFEDFYLSLKKPVDNRTAAQIVEDTKKLHANTEWVVS